MKVLITGKSGFIGSALSKHLLSLGHQVKGLGRKNISDDQPYWDIKKGVIDTKNFTDINCVIHLAGENISTGRWTKTKKDKIKDSRINGTKLISEYFSSLTKKPEILLTGSAIGYYGNRGDETLNEDSNKGSGFLSDVCNYWEDASKAAVDSGIRVVNLRTGMVLGAGGGALQKMLPPFKLGLGGIIGSGKQFISFISIKDVTSAIEFIINNNSLNGPVNLVSPTPVTNFTFTKALGKVIRRPTIFPMPAMLAKLAFGDMAEELLLSSLKVLPGKLIKTNYTFHHPQIEDALSYCID